MRLLAVALFGLSAAPAFAAGSAAALDLSLPQSSWQQPYDGSMARVTPDTATMRRSACPAAADGSDSALTGSVTAGMGYSTRMGSSNYTAANVNYCKSYITNSGNEGAININVQVGRSDGDMYMADPMMRGPGPRHAGPARGR